MAVFFWIDTLPETNSKSTPKRMVGSFLGWPIFRCELLVSKRVVALSFTNVFFFQLHTLGQVPLPSSKDPPGFCAFLVSKIPN